MLSLTLRPSEFPPPPVPDASAPGVEVFRDLSGAVVVLCERRSERHWIHLPHLASYSFDCTSPEVEAILHPRASTTLVVDQFYRTVLPLALQARGREVLHASGVLTPAGVVALSGIKQSGKSTLAFALGRRGFPLWADDAVVVEVESERVVARALPTRLRLRPPSARFFGVETEAVTHAASLEPLPSSSPEPRPLAAVVVLHRVDEEEGAPVEMQRLIRAAAFAEVLTHAYCFSLQEDAHKQAMMEHYLRIVARVPSFSLRYGTGLDNLPAILEAIERAVEGL